MSIDSLNDIRGEFLTFFEKNSHKIYPSDSLIPSNVDKSVLFTNSGMMQFKNLFTGVEKPSFERITTAQKCLRAGGKHNDLENVGYTNRHHTFFEMLGNFSFGNYFKEEAIFFAWEFLTKNLNLNKNKLYFTVYETDEESLKLWQKISGFSEDKIIKIKTEDNFWSMGDSGPCGPCTEIFYDLGEKAVIEGGSLSGKVGENDRYIEIWNLVFMQFEKDINLTRENYKKLPKPCVDTGMGLERIYAVLNGKSDNYESSFFLALIDEIKKIYNISTKRQIEDKKTFYSLRILADHIRAVSFLIADGILPDKTGRGYVLRRIMRRAMRYGHYLNENANLFDKIFEILITPGMANMSNYFAELDKNKSLIKNTILNEEESFKHLLKRGTLLLEEATENGKKNIEGETAFKLYDTYGFPLDLTKDFARENNLKVDEEGFEKLMHNQQEMAKKNWKGNYQKDDLEKLTKIEEQLDKKGIIHSLPLYYEGNNWLRDPKVVALIDKDYNIILDEKEIEKTLKEDFVNIENYKVIFEKTVLYPEGGGQESDKGFFRIRKKNGAYYHDSFFVRVLKITKVNKLILHHFENAELTSQIQCPDDTLQSVLASKRQNAPKNHTATHLLQAALRKVLGGHVMQKGSNVNEEGLRFDFSHNKALTKEEIEKVENLINEWISKANDIKQEEMTKEQANTKGALCFFEDKYGEKVRVIEINDRFENKPISVEFCGGTHVRNTQEIESFIITKETAVSSGVRRIEAVAGFKAKANYWLEKNQKNEEEVLKLQQKNQELKTTLSKKEEEILVYKTFEFNIENFIDFEKNFKEKFEEKVLKNILSLNEDKAREIKAEFKKSLENKEKIALIFIDNEVDSGVFRQFCLNFKGNQKTSLIAMIYRKNEEEKSLFVNILKSSDSNFDCKKIMTILFEERKDSTGKTLQSKFGGIDVNLQGKIGL